MGKIGEWREILRSAAERAAFWARMSWENVRENGEEKVERESGEGVREGKELWIDKEAARSEREERASGAGDERRSVQENNEKKDLRRSAEERETEREDIRERIEKAAEMREGFGAGEIWRERYESEANIEEYVRRAAAGGEDWEKRDFASGEEILMRTAGVGSAEELGLDKRMDYGAEGLSEEIIKGSSIEAVRRRLHYSGSAEMKREMIKMKSDEARGGGEVRIEPIYNNYFESEVDMDEITDRLTERIVDMMARSADGVY